MEFRNDRESTPRDYSAHLNEEVQKQRNNFVNSGKEFASRELDHLCSAVRDASNRLHEKNDFFAQYTDNLVDKLDSASHYLKEENTDRLIDSVDDFAHRHPGLTIGGLLVAGYAATRFFKVGSHE